MFTKNLFTQKDPIAEAIKNIAEQDYKLKLEALKGDQEKLDKNKNNKLDAQDFKILRGEKKAVKEDAEQVEEGWDDMLKAAKERSGPQPSGGSGVKKGRAYGGAAQKSKPEQEDGKVKKEEVESVEEAKFDPLKHVKNPSPAVKKAAKDVKRGSYADRAALMKAGGVKDDRGPRGVTQEEVEQIDELKKSTLASYAKKATDDVSYHSFSAGTRSAKDPERLKDDQKAMKRQAGVSKAVDRLAKEEVESIEERSLTADEKAKMEKNVKGMKKNLAGFKARYGDRAKSVMYATATKQAKRD